jgi:hypothetical protein
MLGPWLGRYMLPSGLCSQGWEVIAYLLTLLNVIVLPGVGAPDKHDF